MLKNLKKKLCEDFDDDQLNNTYYDEKYGRFSK